MSLGYHNTAKFDKPSTGLLKHIATLLIALCLCRYYLTFLAVP
jgi:hypothetical protein